MTPKIKTWVTFDETLKFGEGRARLLELIEQCGSLQRAANALGMSYRNAWGYLGELEGAAGLKFVERAPARAPRSGMRLTKEAKQFLSRYWKFRAAVERSAQRHFAQAFGPGISPGTGRKSAPVRAAERPGKKLPKRAAWLLKSRRKNVRFGHPLATQRRRIQSAGSGGTGA